MLPSTSNILYVRASLKPFSGRIAAAGGALPFLREHFSFSEIFVPHFYGVRPFWRAKPKSGPPKTNSGALGMRIAELPEAVLSRHPSHAFAGIGERVAPVLKAHGSDKPCFYPVGELADRHDFSMLLLGCDETSPGFSTVHVTQNRLGLTQKHLLRYLLRWDDKVASEFPGCSLSFYKFYPFYEADDNLVRGEIDGASWLFVPSARKALAVEKEILEKAGRFVDCERPFCPTCRLRLY